MMYRSTLAPLGPLALTLSLALACSAGSTSSSGTGGTGGSGGDDTAGGNDPGPGGGPSGVGGSAGGFAVGGGGVGGGPEEIAEVFGHSPTQLFRLDPDTKQLTTVGPFNGCSQVIDIALDADSNIVATTFDGLYSVDKTNASCSLIASGNFPNSLSFIPAGTLDPNVEALVGYRFDEYVRIDPATGAISTIGYLGGNGLGSSGDIVSVKGGNTYLTVNGAGCGDCLVQINPSNGSIVQNWGPLGYGSVWGIAFWAGTVYGFNNGGALFEVTFENGVMSTMLVAQQGAEFWGAGSTTSAPPIPIPD